MNKKAEEHTLEDAKKMAECADDKQALRGLRPEGDADDVGPIPEYPGR